MAKKIKNWCFYGKSEGANVPSNIRSWLGNPDEPNLNQNSASSDAGSVGWASAASAIANDFINNELIPYIGYSSRSKVNEYKRQLQGINQSIWNSDFNSNADLMQAYRAANLDNPYYEYEGMDVGQGLLFGLKRMGEGAAIGTSFVPGWGTLIGAAAGIVDAGIQSTVKNASAYKKMASARQAYDDAIMDRQRALNYGIKQINTKNNMLEEFNYADMGGPLNHGTEWKDNIILVDNGGTHEENPYGGVLMGVDAEGIPNLVEEGEVIWNDYVFSNRLNIPMSIRKKYNLKKNGGSLTYADAIKGSKQFKALEEMPNDKITKDSFETFIADLAMSQEEERAKDRMRKSKYSTNKFDEGGAYYTGNNWRDFINWISSYSQNKSVQSGKYRDASVSRFGKYKTPKELEAEKEYGKYTEDVINALNQKDNPYAKALVLEYLKAYNSSLPENAQWRIIDKNGELVDGWEKQFRNVRTNQFGTGHLSALNFADLVNNYRDEILARTDNTSLPLHEWSAVADDTEVEEEGLPVGTPTLADAAKANNPRTKSPIGVEALRYAPVFGNLAAMLGTAATPVDYSNIARYENFGLNAPIVSTHPIGNYMEYKPFDINYAANRLGARAANRRRLLSDLSGGNAATARANIIASDYEAQNDIGDLLIAAADSNLKQRINRDTFNRETDKYNSTDAARADAANTGIWNTKLGALMRGASERDVLDTRRSAAISQNLTALSENLGNIGREEFIFNQLDSNPALLYKYLSKNGQIGYSGSKGGLLTVKKIRRK